MATRMQQRRGTAAQWTAANPTLAAGEIGFETDTSKFKMGNGSSAWTALTYFASATELNAAIANLIDAAPGTLDTLNELAAALGDDPAFFTNISASISGSIDQHNGTTSVHGIANTALLATLTNVSTAQTDAQAFATTAIGNAMTTHSADTTSVHGIVDTALLATQAYADSAVGTHQADTTEVHGIANTALLATQAYADTAVSTHASDVTEVHGISNTADLATKSYADTAVSTHSDDTLLVHGIADTADLATKTYADTAVSTHAALTENIHGIADTSLLATQDFVATAVSNSEVDQSALAGVGIDWNSVNSRFDIDSTVATTTHVSTEIGTHNSATTSVHGIANTALLATTADVAAVTKTSLGLGNVDNTADASKPVSTAQSQAIATAKSEAIADATSQVNALLTGAPAALNTLDELAAALGDDANFASSVTTSLGLKVDSLTPISQKTASYTLSSLTERDDLIEMGSATGVTLTIPTDATLNFPIGTSIDILQTGAGQVTIAPVSGTVTVNATPGLKLRTTWSSATLFKRAANTWVVFGDLTA
jgi:hypothetical protein